MLVDKTMEIADDVSGAQIAGSYNMGTPFDMLAAGIDPNSANNLYLVITVSQAFASAGAATVQFRLQSDGVTPIVPGTSTQHGETEVFAYTELTVGKRIIIPLPKGIKAYERYLGVVMVIGTATTTAGKINALITMDAELWYPTADAVN